MTGVCYQCIRGADAVILRRRPLVPPQARTCPVRRPKNLYAGRTCPAASPARPRKRLRVRCNQLTDPSVAAGASASGQCLPSLPQDDRRLLSTASVVRTRPARKRPRVRCDQLTDPSVAADRRANGECLPSLPQDDRRPRRVSDTCPLWVTDHGGGKGGGCIQADDEQRLPCGCRGTGLLLPSVPPTLQVGHPPVSEKSRAVRRSPGAQHRSGYPCGADIRFSIFLPAVQPVADPFLRP
jgi:hypothetical protein